MWSMMRPCAVLASSRGSSLVEEAVVDTTPKAARPKARPSPSTRARCRGAQGTTSSLRRLQPRFPIVSIGHDQLSNWLFRQTASVQGFGRSGCPLETSKQVACLIGKGLNFHPNLTVFYKLGPILDLFRIGLLLRDFSERHDGRRVTRRGCAETFESGVCTSKTSGRCEQVVLVLSECGLKWSTGFYWIDLKSTV